MRNILSILFFVAALYSSAQSGPGGVGTSSNNVLWLDANSGVSHLLGAVHTWSDRSGNGNHAYLPLTIPLGTPNLVNGAVNGNRALDFDGVDDQLWVAHHSSLNLTQWHFFMVVTADLQKDYNAWITKGDDSDENFEMLSYSDGNIHAPIKWTDGTRTHPSTAAGQVTTSAFDIIEYSYRSSTGRDIYKNGTNVQTDNENKTPQTNSRPLYIGNERSTSGRELNGKVAEVIAYNAPLNTTQRLVVNNYLSAKYARTLSAGDIYLQDNAGQGNYDYDVAGIGRASSTDLVTDAKGSGLVRISNARNLGNNEFLLWGHDGGASSANVITGLPAGVEARWQRVWRVNEVSASGTAVDVGGVDIIWDLSSFAPVVPADLRMLVDANNNNNFADDAVISGATALGSGQFQFTNVTAISNNTRFTIATANFLQTPLPVEFISFRATPVGAHTVQLDWATASERDNHSFTVQRSHNTQEWHEIVTVDAVGNSQQETRYTATDGAAPLGISYYRVMQTDLDGSTSHTTIAAVEIRPGRVEGLLIAPNPALDRYTITIPEEVTGSHAVKVIDQAGRMVVQHHSMDGRNSLSSSELPGLSSGTYTVIWEHAKGTVTGRLVVE